MKRYLVLLSLLAVFPVESTTIYRWIDEKGITHFSQTPPPVGQVQEIQVQVPHGPPPSSLKTLETMKEAPPKEEDRARAEEQARIKKEVCSALRKNLETLERYPRLYRKDEQGNVVWITEKERQALIKKTRAQLKEFCKEAPPATGP
ncbi:MAG: DUF4124 domain-containing protein [Gammaproteobacteria bacterium]|nr:MAG: DUF4124 domain-containing protein [Gammaproteobacteria bacterium]